MYRHFGPRTLRHDRGVPTLDTGAEVSYGHFGTEYLHRRPVTLQIMQRPIGEYQRGYKPLELNLKLLNNFKYNSTGL